jgi:cyanophycin synthetase
VLGDPTVDAAVLEVARGGLLRGGLGYDLADVAVLTTITADHLVHVKAVVAEQVRESGTLVLNADDPNVLGLIDRPHVRAGERTVVLVSPSPTHPAVVGTHERVGGWTYVVDHGCLVERRGTSEAGVLPVDEVPGALGSAAVHQLTNALLAIAAARAIGFHSPWWRPPCRGARRVPTRGEVRCSHSAADTCSWTTATTPKRSRRWRR